MGDWCWPRLVPHTDTLSSTANWDEQSSLALPDPCIVDGKRVGFRLAGSLRLCSEHPLTPLPGPSDFHLPFFCSSRLQTPHSAALSDAAGEGRVSIRKEGFCSLMPLRNTHGNPVLLLSLSHKTCVLTCAVICPWDFSGFISTSCPSVQPRMRLFQSLGRQSTACTATSLCLKERNNPGSCPAATDPGFGWQPLPSLP